MAQRNEDELSYQIVGAAIEVHCTLGGLGLLESIYESSHKIHKAQLLTYLRVVNGLFAS